jgi:hypothetical protein
VFACHLTWGYPMKRFVLLLLCVALCLCVLAAPAFAKRSSPHQRPYRPDTAAQYVWGQWWWEYSGATGTAADVSWWWCETPPPDDPDPFWDEYYRPVSNDRPILKTEFTLGVGYGLIRHIPNIILATYDVTGVDGEAAGYSAHYSAAEVKAYWTRPYVWDEFWTGWWDALFVDGWVPGPFNPKIGAAIYGTYLKFPLFPEETPEGDPAEPPKPGVYHVAMSYRQALPWNEMLYWGDPSLPTHAPPGAEWAEEFDMVVVD